MLKNTPFFTIQRHNFFPPYEINNSLASSKNNILKKSLAYLEISTI